MSSLHPQNVDSDSEEDDDYVPPAEAESSSSEDENESKQEQGQGESRRVTNSVEDERAKKAAKDAMWASFQASATSSQPGKGEEEIPKRTVKIEKRYKFAGEDVIEVVEVDEDSADAKKWPLWRPPEESMSPGTSRTQQIPVTSPTTPSEQATDVTPAQKPPARRPGPRKPKTSLAAIPSSQKPKKLTTLEKSAMDWRAHVTAESSSGLQDELEANRRGGGYLEKVDFLKRVEGRKEDILEASRTTKRRKT